jgi:hypothetical protein
MLSLIHFKLSSFDQQACAVTIERSSPAVSSLFLSIVTPWRVLSTQIQIVLSPSLTLANYYESAISRCPRIQASSKENSPAFSNDEIVTIWFIALQSGGFGSIASDFIGYVRAKF